MRLLVLGVVLSAVAGHHFASQPVHLVLQRGENRAVLQPAPYVLPHQTPFQHGQDGSLDAPRTRHTLSDSHVIQGLGDLRTPKGHPMAAEVPQRTDGFSRVNAEAHLNSGHIRHETHEENQHHQHVHQENQYHQQIHPENQLQQIHEGQHQQIHQGFGLDTLNHLPQSLSNFQHRDFQQTHSSVPSSFQEGHPFHDTKAVVRSQVVDSHLSSSGVASPSNELLQAVHGFQDPSQFHDSRAVIQAQVVDSPFQGDFRQDQIPRLGSTNELRQELHQFQDAKTVIQSHLVDTQFQGASRQDYTDVASPTRVAGPTLEVLQDINGFQDTKAVIQSKMVDFTGQTVRGILSEPMTPETELLTEEVSGILEPLDLPSGARLLLGDVSSSFTCAGQPYGYYADEEVACKVFHVCYPARFSSGHVETYRYSFMCGPGTRFDQRELTCVRDNEAIPCAASSRYFFRNTEFGLPRDAAVGF